MKPMPCHVCGKSMPLEKGWTLRDWPTGWVFVEWDTKLGRYTPAAMMYCPEHSGAAADALLDSIETTSD